MRDLLRQLCIYDVNNPNRITIDVNSYENEYGEKINKACISFDHPMDILYINEYAKISKQIKEIKAYSDNNNTAWINVIDGIFNSAFDLGDYTIDEINQMWK